MHPEDAEKHVPTWTKNGTFTNHIEIWRFLVKYNAET